MAVEMGELMKIIIIRKNTIIFWNIILGIFFVMMSTPTINYGRKLVYKSGRIVVENRIVNQLESYLQVEGPYARIYYTEQDETYVPLIRRAIETYYPMLLQDFQMEHKKQIAVIMYPSGESMMAALEMEGGDAPMGVYYGSTLNILSPEIWTKGQTEIEIKERFLKDGPIVHELTHLVLDDKTMGNYPLWFTEGVALYYEYKYTGFEWRKDVRHQSRDIDIKTLTKEFHKLDEVISYRRAFDIIYELVQQKGEEGLQQIIDQMAQGTPLERAFKKAFGLSIEVVDNF